MKKALKFRLLLIFTMVLIMVFYIKVFGNANLIIGLMVFIAALLNLGNDLSYKPKASFVKLLVLLLILGIGAYINSPITSFGCVLTFFIVFATTFSSYHLFGTHVYRPFLVIYTIMVARPVGPEDLPMRLMSLAFGAVFIVGFNLVLNGKKYSNFNKYTVSSLIDEIIGAVELKLDGKEVAIENFNVADGFYRSAFSKFEHKFFPTQKNESYLNIIKSLQFIGWVISKCDLSLNELNYIKIVLNDFKESKTFDIENIPVEHEEMNLVVLNLKVIKNELENSHDKTSDNIPDMKAVIGIVKPLVKRQFSFKSAKFTFAFKMALVLTLCEIITVLFNFPYATWLYFAAISIMLPHIDDVLHSVKSRVIGTFVGSFAFLIILIALPFIPISTKSYVGVALLVGTVGILLSIKNRPVRFFFMTIMSLSASLLCIAPPKAIELKILWVFTAILVVNIINYGFLPFSIEKETKNNLKSSYKLNKQFVEMIKSKCEGKSSFNKTSLIVISNMIRENIQLTSENEELYYLQSKIINISYTILNYMEIYELSDEMKDEMIKIIDGGEFKDNNSPLLYSLNHVVELLDYEKELINNL